MSNYGDPHYWEQRYSQQQGQRFDWLEDYHTLKDHLQKCMIKGKLTKILNIGCGNGETQDQLYEAGYEEIVNNDISHVLIKQMSQSNKYPKMAYEVMDVTEMTYEGQSFDLVLDKSTIDALLCSNTPLVSVAKMIRHIHRILVDDGYYFVVSYGTPGTRLIHFSRSHVNFQVKVTEIEGRNGTSHFIYCCKKKAMKHDEEAYQELLKQLAEEECKLISEGLDPEQSAQEQSGQLFNEAEMKNLFQV